MTELLWMGNTRASTIELTENHHLTFTKFNFPYHFSRLQTLLKITSADQPLIRIPSSHESAQTARGKHKIKNCANFRKAFIHQHLRILLNQNQHRQLGQNADSPLIRIQKATSRKTGSGHSCGFWFKVLF